MTEVWRLAFRLVLLHLRHNRTSLLYTEGVKGRLGYSGESIGYRQD